MNVDDSTKNERSLGLVPLYPFPSIYSNPYKSLNEKQSTGNALPFGSFLPPIFNSYFDVSFIEEMAPLEGERILSELITEEVLDIFGELFEEGGSFLEETLENEVKQKTASRESVSKSIAREILHETIAESCRDIVLDCLDDIVKDHTDEIESRLSAEIIYLELEKDMISEVVKTSVTSEAQENECDTILNEIVADEVQTVAEEMLVYCGAKQAFSQYMRIAKFAADPVLDGMVLQTLLPRPETQKFDLSYVLDDMVFAILMNKTLEVIESSKQDDCIPLLWYRKKLLQNILLDMTLNELTELNNS